jgi:hypothetical protein
MMGRGTDEKVQCHRCFAEFMGSGGRFSEPARESRHSKQPEVITTIKSAAPAVGRKVDQTLRWSLQKRVKDYSIDRARGHQQRNHNRIYSGGFHHRASESS